jgi:2-oxoacid:acceptor oxidoreductase gamma subunit (pyruvate/2-ketoisovalerate family)
MHNIIVYGRGGQGAKTAAHVLAEAAFLENKYVLSFPEYGPERSGAPMRTFVKIDDKPISDYAPIQKADYIVVIDSSLINLPKLKEKIIEACHPKTIVLVNSKVSVDLGKIKVKALDASEIALRNIGKDFSNVILMSALVKISKIVKLDSLEKAIRETLSKKPALLELNLKAIKEAYNKF